MRIKYDHPFVLLFALFVVLRVTHLIEWSWWWVTAPLWGSAVAAWIIVGVLWVIETPAERAIRRYVRELDRHR